MRLSRLAEKGSAYEVPEHWQYARGTASQMPTFVGMTEGEDTTLVQEVNTAPMSSPQPIAC